MAELTIRLVIDPDSGKKNVVISYDSDSDAMPMEHEEEHKRLVDQLIEGGALAEGELGNIIVEREESAADAASEPSSEQSVSERESISEDS